MGNEPKPADHSRTTFPELMPEGLSRPEFMHWLAERTPPLFLGKPAWVYFIGCTATGVKIGTGTNIDARLREIQRCCPIPLALLALRPGGIARERAYHEQFKAHRLHGEWFAPHPDILAEIDRLRRIAA